MSAQSSDGLDLDEQSSVRQTRRLLHMLACSPRRGPGEPRFRNEVFVATHGSFWLFNSPSNQETQVFPRNATIPDGIRGYHRSHPHSSPTIVDVRSSAEAMARGAQVYGSADEPKPASQSDHGWKG